MKSGIFGNVKDPDNYYPYWVMPDRTMKIDLIGDGFIMGGPDWDSAELQTHQIKRYLSEVCEGAWTEQNYRFCFALESDWESFKVMCLMGWQ